VKYAIDAGLQDDQFADANGIAEIDVIDEVATRIWHFEGDGHIDDFKGPYADYLIYAERKAAQAKSATAGRAESGGREAKKAVKR